MAFPENQQLTDALFAKICAYVYSHARINLTEAKRNLVQTRLGKVIREKKFRGFSDFYKYMTDDDTGAALQEVLNAVSTNLTSFFREPKHFDFLHDTLIPRLVQQKEKTGERSLRAWSAGSSSGEEAYTLSMVLSEGLPTRGNWDARILASDIDTNMLKKGSQGIYEAKRAETIPPRFLKKYFQPTADGAYQAIPQLRNMIKFRLLNLMGKWPFKKKFDFIFCRNVMIYFDKPTQESLVGRFHDHLAPGGHLFIGHSEGLSGLKHKFSYVLPTVYIRDK